MKNQETLGFITIKKEIKVDGKGTGEYDVTILTDDERFKEKMGTSYQSIDRDYIPEEGSDYDERLPKSDAELVEIIKSQTNPKTGKVSAFGQDALNYLIAKNKKLIERCIYELTHKYTKESFDQDSLYQAGRIGIMNAVRGYDPDKDAQFSTYAVYYINNELRQEVSETLDSIRIPENIKADIRRIAQYKKKHPEYPDSEIKTYMLKDEIFTREETYNTAELFSRLFNVQHIDGILNSDEESVAVDIKDFGADDPEDYSIRQDAAAAIKRVLDDLPEKQKKAAEMLFGFEKGKTYSVAEIMKELNLSEREVKRIRNDLTERLNRTIEEYSE